MWQGSWSVCLAMPLAFLAHHALALSVESTPIQKVIDMLGEMKMKGSSAKQLEQKIFKEYSTWAAGQIKEYEEEVGAAKDTIAELTAFVEKANNDISNYGKKIKGIDTQTKETEDSLGKSKAEREEQHAKFLADQTDYTESLYALEQAIQTLKAQSYDRSQALLQLQHMARSKTSLRRVIAMLEIAQEEQDRASAAPAVAAYEFQSSGIVDMLEDLKKKFQAEINDLQKSEMNENHAFEMEAVNLEHMLENLKAEREQLTEVKAKTTEDSAAARGKLADTKTSLAETSALLSETKTTLTTKTAAFESNQKVRAEEIIAIEKALEILKGSEVSGAYAEHINAEFVQQQQQPKKLQKVALLQLNSHSRRVASCDRAAEFLQHRAKALRSKTLASLATQIAANPFEKVITMIKDLLAKLKDEANSEADHKAFCDEELAKNEAERKKQTSKAATLQAEIQLLQAKIADMAEQIATLSQEQAELKDAMAAATKTRNEEKAANTKAIEDSMEAQVAMKQAISVLKTFYASQGTFLLQRGSEKQVPEMAAYKGMQSSEGGIIGMLEVIESDFARLEADTKASEAQAASEHKAFMTLSTKSAEEKHDAEFQLSLDKDQHEFLEEQAQKDLASTNTQLEAATSYFEELKPQCVEVNVSYAERAQRREDEIAALKQAYEILDSKAR